MKNYNQTTRITRKLKLRAKMGAGWFLLLLVALVFSSVEKAPAQTSQSDGEWNNTAVLNPTPGILSSVIIKNAVTIGSVPDAASAFAVTINNPGILTLEGTGSLFTFIGVTVSSGTLALEDTSSLTVGGAVALNSGNITLSGSSTLGVGGSVTVNSGNLTIEDSSSLSTIGVVTVSAGSGVLTLQSGSLTAGGVMTVSGTFSFQGGTLNAGVFGLVGNGGGTLELGDGVNMGTSAPLHVNTTDASSPFYINVATGTATISGGISNVLTPGFIAKTGAGTLILDSANTYSGGTFFNEGTVSVSADNNLGAATGTLTFNGGTLETTAGFSSNREVTLNTSGTFQVDTDTLTLTNTITGAGSLTKTGAGQLTLSGTNDYSGGTTISAGNILAQNDSALGTGAVAIDATGTLTVDDNIQLGINGLTGAAGSNVVLNANSALTVTTASGTDTFAGNISSDPAGYEFFLKLGAGTLALSGTNDINGVALVQEGELDLNSATALSQNTFLEIASGATTVVNGVDVQVGELVTTGSDGDLVLNGGGITIASPNAATNAFDGNISGTGSLTMDSVDSIQTLGGNNTYSGATTITQGTLQAGSTTGLSANSDFTVNSEGTLDLNGFSNTIASLSGDGTVTNSDSEGNNATLTVGSLESSAATTFAGTIQDGANATTALELAGGQLTLSTANTYTGGTTVNGGTLIAANSSAFGTGVVTLNGGVLQTDNVNHIISIGNNFVQNGGTLSLNINGLPGALSNDVVNVNGTAKLDGSLSIIYNAGTIGPKDSETYTVITTTGGVTDVGPGYLPPSLQAGALQISITGSVVGNDFDVILSGIQTPFTALGGTNFTPNQHSVASYFDRFDTTVSTGPIIPLIKALDAVSVNPSQVGPAFDQLTPLKFGSFASTTGINNATFFTQQMDNYFASHRGADGNFISSNGGIDYSGLVMNNPNTDAGLQSVRSHLLAWSPTANTALVSDSSSLVSGGIDMKDVEDVAAKPGQDNLWNVFVSGNVILAQDFSNTTAGNPFANTTTGAVQVGADYKLSPHWLVGAMFGFGHTDATLDTIGSNASVDTYSPTVYTSYSENGWYANGIASYGFASYDQNRAVSIGAFNGTANSTPGGDQIIANLDGGYDFHRKGWTFGPTAGLVYTHLDVNGYTETGLPGADLTVSSQQADSLRSRLGGAVSYAFQGEGLTFTPHFSASWQHEFFDQSRGITSQFNSVGAGSFVVNTSGTSRDSALVDLGLDIQINDALTTFVDYAAQAGQSNYFGQSIQAGFKIGF